VNLNPGDHICAIYATGDELAGMVAPYLAEGLRRGERCWFLPAADGVADVVRALTAHGVDVDVAVRRGALVFADSAAAYAARGNFDPEETLAVFGAAIEDALNDGFRGFRAAAEMSWLLDVDGGEERIVTYEALLKSLFSNGHATGMCLYDRNRMPLNVIAGALATHPIARAAQSGYRLNPFYDATVTTTAAVEPGAVASRLAQLEREPVSASNDETSQRASP
jgi:hypothetical protein